MESALELWQARESENWILGCDTVALRARVRARHAEFSHRPASAPLEITTEDPASFVAEFLAAMTYWTPLTVFLGQASAGTPGAADERDTRLMIATGGTSGAPRYAVHTWATLTTAARSLQQALGGEPIHSVCFLPLSHVSGLMQVVRSFVSGGKLTLADWRAIQVGRFPPVSPGSVTSLVPTQLVRLLDVPGALPWLHSFRAVFVGGAATWSALLERARRLGLPLAPCYGMTETAAQVTMLPPAEFLAGRRGVGRALPHAQVEIVDEFSEDVLPAGVAGRIRVRAGSLFRGYHFDAGVALTAFLTLDRGVRSPEGDLTVLGRLDAVINSGGEKVDPAIVEAAVRDTALVTDVAVVGVPDPEWGEVVVAVIAGARTGAEQEIAARVRAQLAGPQRPKRWVHVAALPRNDAGKINREALRALVTGTPG